MVCIPPWAHALRVLTLPTAGVDLRTICLRLQASEYIIYRDPEFSLRGERGKMVMFDRSQAGGGAGSPAPRTDPPQRSAAALQCNIDPYNVVSE